MPLPFTVGTSRTLMWRRRNPVVPSGPTYLFRDQFSTAVNPLVDGTAEPGPGTRDVTGSLWKIISGSLRGGAAFPTGTWGASKIVYDAQTRADGLTLWAIVKPMDKDGQLGVGWTTTTAVTDPETNGHHWINDIGLPRVSQPGTLVSLNLFDIGKIGAIRPVEYLVAVVARAQGAFYLISCVQPQTRTGVNNSNDYIGIPQYPDARVLWVDDATTTTPIYPHISAKDRVGPPHEHMIDDLRVDPITEWATDQGLATMLDRLTRADSTTSIGTGWTNLRGTFGVSSNQAYCQATVGHNVASKSSGLSGDGIWRFRVTAPTTTTNQFGVAVRIVDNNNFIIFHNGGGNFLKAHSNVAGAFTEFMSTAFTWTAGQTYEWVIITKGNQYQWYIDGVLKFDWTADATNAHLTASGMGPYTFNVVATGARWDDFMAVPNTITLPATLQTGTTPHIFTPGTTIATDDFTAADGTTLSGRTTTTGGKTWTTVGTGWQITGNKAVNTNINSAGDTHFFAYLDAGTTDVELSVDITGPPVDDYLMKGFVVRWVDVNNHIYIRQRMGSDQPANDEIEVHEIINGVFTDITKGQFGDYYALNTVKSLKVQLVGNIMHVFLGGELVITYVIDSALTGTRHGLYHSNRDDNSQFDNFVMKALS